MAFKVAISTDVLHRSSGLVAASSNYTCTFWLRADESTGKLAFKCRNAANTAWVGIFFDAATLDLYFGVNAGAGETTTLRTTLIKDFWYPIAYVRSVNDHKLYIGAKLIDTKTVNIAAVTFSDYYLLGDGGVNKFASIFGFKEYSSALTLAQLIAEWNAVDSVLAAATDTPLLNDLADDSGNGHNWTFEGASTDPLFVTTPAQSPLTNTGTGTAATFPALPGEAVQVVNDGAGTNQSVYWKTTPNPVTRVIGAWAFSTNIGSGYRPVIRPMDVLTNFVLNIHNVNMPVQFPIEGVGPLWYVMIDKNANNTVPAFFNLRMEAAPLNPIARGNIVVNDDHPGFPIAILSHLTDHTVINFIVNGKPTGAVPVDGEGGDVLPSGPILVENFDLTRTELYNLQFVDIASPVPPGAGGFSAIFIRANNRANKFYVGVDKNPPIISKILPDGTIEATTYTLTGTTSLYGMAASNDETVFFFSAAAVGVPIKRWDLVNNVALTDFVAALAGYINPDILVLNDDTILILWHNATTKDSIVKRYNMAGTLLNTFALGTSNDSNSPPRIAYALDNPNSFWAWLHQLDPTTLNEAISHFKNIKISDGSIITDRVHTVYSEGIYGAIESGIVTSRFGSAASCPFFIYPAAGAGMYTIVPGKRHDTIDVGVDKKIPKPTFRTALVP